MVTILMPTLNRSSFVIRYLNYFHDNGFEGRLFIADSSNDEHFQKTSRAIAAINPSFEVRHLAYPGLKIFECIQQMIPMVDTPYVMYMNDDDLIVPSSLKEAIAFLAKNPDYSAAGGEIVCCHLNLNEDRDEVLHTTRTSIRSFTAPEPSQRLIGLAERYSMILFSVYRSHCMKFMWPLDPRLKDVSMGSEVLPAMVLAAQGKIKKLDRIFTVRQIHIQRYVTPNMYESVTKPHWIPSLLAMQDAITKALMDKGLPEAEAMEDAKRACWSFAGGSLSRGYARRYRVTAEKKIKDAVKQVPFVGSMAVRLKAELDPAQFLSLPRLLRKTSAYHQDFMPAYRCITAAKGGG